MTRQQTEPELPPLPAPIKNVFLYDTRFAAAGRAYFTAQDMRDYARAAIAADRVKRFEGPVLTYEEVREICKIGDLEGVAQRQLTVRATESAVLAKLEQENNRLRAPKPRAGIDFVMMPKTGRDLYYRHVGEDRNNMHEWCELPIDEQVAWNDKAKEQS